MPHTNGPLSSLKAIALRLKPGQDLKQELDDFVKAHQVKAATMLTCVGSLQKAVIRYADKKESDTISGKLQIVSLTGTFAETGSHLHFAVSDCTGKTIGGHLKEGSIIYTTAEVVLGVLTEVAFERETDANIGYKELVIKTVNIR